MEPEARYRALLDSEAPADLWEAAMQGEVQREYLMYKCLNRSEAEGYEDEIEPYLDFRSSTGRCALVRCSACGEQMLADYLPSKQDRANRSGIRLWRDGEKKDCRDGQKLVCPLCGAAADVEHVSGMRWGRGQEAWVVVPQLQNGILAFTEWYCTRRVYLDREIHSNEPVCCYLADTEKRKVVRCNLYRRGMGGHLYRLEGWEQTKRLVDRCGAVRKLYDRVLPDLAGTSLANSRLWEYRDSVGQEFCPISYIRLYWKHPNAENLVAAGAGGLLSAGFEAEAERTGYYYTALTYNAPKLDFVDWKKAKPAQMLRLTKDKLRVVMQKRWSLQELKLWRKAEGRMPFAAYCNALELYGTQELARAVELEAALQRQKEAEAAAEQDRKERDAALAATEKLQAEAAQHKKALEKARAQGAAEAAKKARAEVRMENEARLNTEKAAREAAEERAAQLAKQLQVSSDESTVKFGLLFGQLQDNAYGIDAICKELAENGDSEKAGKFRAALGRALTALAQTLGND